MIDMSRVQNGIELWSSLSSFQNTSIGMCTIIKWKQIDQKGM